MPPVRHFHAHETARFDQLAGLPLATFKRRAIALLIDFTVIALFKVVLWLFIGRHFGHSESAEAHGWEHWVETGFEDLKSLFESVLYFGVCFKVGRGQTIGKKIMNIRVLSLTQQELSWWQSIERALGYGASLLEAGFGFFQYFLNRNRMTVHDRIAETIVVDLREDGSLPTRKQLKTVQARNQTPVDATADGA